MEDVLHELKLRCKSGKLAEIQRMYGVALGLRIALKQYEYTYEHPQITHLIRNEFGTMSLKQIKDFAFLKETEN